MAGKRKLDDQVALFEAAKKVLQELRPVVRSARGSAWKKQMLQKIDAILEPKE